MANIDFQKYARRMLSNFSGKTSIHFDDIFETKLFQEPYTNYINNEIEKEINEIVCILESLSFINPQNKLTRELLTKFIDELRHNIEFSLSKFQLLLQSAIKLRYHYLSKPISTLLFFIFGDSLLKSKSEILQKLNYFVDYKIILDRIVLHIERLPKDSISIYEFNSILYNTITEYFNSASNDDLIDFFNPIYEFFNFYDEDSPNPPTEFFFDFFNDIGLIHFSQLFKNYCATKNILHINKATLQEVLLNFSDTFRNLINNKQSQISVSPSKNLINLSPLESFVFELPSNIPTIDENLLQKSFTKETNVVAKHQEIDEIKKLLSELDGKSISKASETTPTENEKTLNSELIIASNDTIPTDEVFKESLTTEIPETTILDAEIKQETHEIVQNNFDYSYATNLEQEENIVVSATETPEEYLNKESENKIEQTKTTSLEELIDENKRKQFINELFYSIEEEYQKLIEKVDNSDSFDTAMEFINSCFTELDIFPEMPIAKEFVDIVKQKFNQSKSSE